MGYQDIYGVLGTYMGYYFNKIRTKACVHLYALQNVFSYTEYVLWFFGICALECVLLYALNMHYRMCPLTCTIEFVLLCKMCFHIQMCSPIQNVFSEICTVECVLLNQICFHVQMCSPIQNVFSEICTVEFVLLCKMCFHVQMCSLMQNVFL